MAISISPAAAHHLNEWADQLMRGEQSVVDLPRPVAAFYYLGWKHGLEETSAQRTQLESELTRLEWGQLHPDEQRVRLDAAHARLAEREAASLEHSDDLTSAEEQAASVQSFVDADLEARQPEKQAGYAGYSEAEIADRVMSYSQLTSNLTETVSLSEAANTHLEQWAAQLATGELALHQLPGSVATFYDLGSLAARSFAAELEHQVDERWDGVYAEEQRTKNRRQGIVEPRVPLSPLDPSMRGRQAQRDYELDARVEERLQGVAQLRAEPHLGGGGTPMNNEKITVYSTPDCSQCKMTYRLLDNKNIDYDVVDLTQDETAMQMVKDLGYTRAPVVVAGAEHWSGFRPDKLAGLSAVSSRTGGPAAAVAQGKEHGVAGEAIATQAKSFPAPAVAAVQGQVSASAPAVAAASPRLAYAASAQGIGR